MDEAGRGRTLGRPAAGQAGRGVNRPRHERNLSVAALTLLSVTLFDHLDRPPGTDQPDPAGLVGHAGAADPAAPRIEIRRSARRTRTVSAYRQGDTIVVLVPARLSRSAERRLVEDMVARVTSKESKLAAAGPRAGDRPLHDRALRLSAQYLDGRATPLSVRWVDNMNHRWGSCTSTDRTIRISRRLASMPDWVVDYVLVHELAHLLEADHGSAFWTWVARYPRSERARGYLEGVSAAAQLPPAVDGSPD